MRRQRVPEPPAAGTSPTTASSAWTDQSRPIDLVCCKPDGSLGHDHRPASAVKSPGAAVAQLLKFFRPEAPDARFLSYHLH